VTAVEGTPITFPFGDHRLERLEFVDELMGKDWPAARPIGVPLRGLAQGVHRRPRPDVVDSPEFGFARIRPLDRLTRRLLGRLACRYDFDRFGGILDDVGVKPPPPRIAEIAAVDPSLKWCVHRSSLLDQLVGGGEERFRQSQAEGFGGLEVDHQREFRGLLDRQIRGLHALEQSSNILGA
jgi:hypothetical protein